MLRARTSPIEASDPLAQATEASQCYRAWSTAIESLPMNMAIVDSSGKIVAANEVWRRFSRHGDLTSSLGGDCDPIRSLDQARLIDPGDAGRANEGIRAVLDGREASFSMEYSCHSSDRQCWRSMQVSPVGKQATQGAIVVHEDITARKLGELELQQCRRQLQEQRHLLEQCSVEKVQRTHAILDSALDAVITADDQGVIESLNTAAAQLLGCAAVEVIGRPLATYFVVPPTVAGGRIAEASGSSLETFALRNDGTTIPIYLSTSSVTLSGKALRLYIAHDITDRRVLEAELLDKAQELARRNRELDEFTYVASHDLQEPLRKLIAFSELLPGDMTGVIPELAQRDLHFISEASKRMQQLIQDLLTLARTSRAALQRVEIPLNTCLDRVLSNMATRIVESGATITRDELPCMMADTCLIEQLYQNLIANAIKFSGSQPPRIHLTAQREKVGLVLGVRDHGIGIASEYLTMIFAPFKRLHSRDAYDGTGIGLAICRKAVERHCGRLWVESTLGEGSHFKFTLGQ